MTTPHIGCLILPGLHSGRWYSAISEISMLCSEAYFSNIHACTINMNWWRRNCKTCNPAQNSISNRYLILPSITKSSKLLDGREMSYFAQFFPAAPRESNSIFHQKLQWRQQNKDRALSRGGSVTHLKAGDGAWWVGGLGEGLIRVPAAFWLYPNGKDLSENGLSCRKIPRMLHKCW